MVDLTAEESNEGKRQLRGINMNNLISNTSQNKTARLAGYVLGDAAATAN